jgi:hypothetical protein
LVRAAGIGKEAKTEGKLEDRREKSNPPRCQFPAIDRGPKPARRFLPRRSMKFFEAEHRGGKLTRAFNIG